MCESWDAVKTGSSQVDPLGACSHAWVPWPLVMLGTLGPLGVYSHMASCIEHVHLGVHPIMLGDGETLFTIHCALEFLHGKVHVPEMVTK